MKILLAGMNNYPNQFSRSIERYGCEVVHISGDAGGTIPICHAAIISKGHISHTKFDQVKERYKSVGKPYFIVDQSFSVIKERFEAFLNQYKHLPKTAMAQAFVQAQTPTPPIEEQDMHKKRMVHTKDVVEKIHKIVKDCYQANMTPIETVEMLASEGLKKASGEPFKNQDISGLRWTLGLRPQQTIVVSETVNEVAPAPPKPRLKMSNQLELIGKVLSANIDSDRKLDLVEKIQSGTITSETAAITRKIRLPGSNGEGIEVLSASIFADTDRSMIVLTKPQAIAILEVIESLEAFVGR